MFDFTVAQGASYMVMTAWDVYDENVNEALFSIFDGPSLEKEVVVNQQVEPADLFQDGHDWHTLGVFTVSSMGAYNLRVMLEGSADGRVVADAVRIVEVGPTTTYTYNAFGEQTSATDPLGNTTLYYYDMAGRETMVVYPDPDGAGPELPPVVTRSYDSAGNVISETDPLNNTTTHTYDELFRRTSTTDANNDTTLFTYDLRSQLTSLTDPSGNVTTFQYDLLGRLVAEEIVIDGVTESRTYEYDLAGNLTRETDRNGRVTDYTYDALHRPVTETWYADAADADLGINAINLLTWDYDVLHRVTNESDSNSNYGYNYDALDRVLDVTAYHFGDIGPITLTNGYTRQDGLRTSLTASINGLGDFVNTYEYNDRGLLTSLQQSSAGAPVAEKRVDFGWRPDDRPDGITRYADLAGTQLVAGTTFGYDEQSRLTDITHSQNATILADYDLVFDDASRLTQFTSSVDGAIDYGYDDRGQITSADYASASITDESFTYDPDGNRTTTGFVTDEHNRYSSDGTYDYTYDAEGNRTLRTEIATDATTEYQWDHQNRLTTLIDRDDQGNVTQTVDYEYDLHGRRILKSIDDGTIVESERYVYDGQHIALQFDGNGDLTNRYLHGPAIDQILADEQISNPNAAGDVLWALTDHLGTVRDLAEYDDTTGITDIANHIVYDSFGQVVSETDATVDHIFGYTGRETDEESDLNFYRARYYDPAIGQFISEDPIGFEAGDANTRRYVSNAPTTNVDPTGNEGENVLNARGQGAHMAIQQQLKRLHKKKAVTEKAVVRNTLSGQAEGRVDAVAGSTRYEIKPATPSGVYGAIKDVDSLNGTNKRVILYESIDDVLHEGEWLRHTTLKPSDVRLLHEEIKANSWTMADRDKIYNRARELGTPSRVKVTSSAVKAQGYRYINGVKVEIPLPKKAKVPAKRLRRSRSGHLQLFPKRNALRANPITRTLESRQLGIAMAVVEGELQMHSVGSSGDIYQEFGERLPRILLNPYAAARYQTSNGLQFSANAMQAMETATSAKQNRDIDFIVGVTG